MTYTVVQDGAVLKITEKQKFVISAGTLIHELTADQRTNPFLFGLKKFKNVRTIITIQQNLIRKGVMARFCINNLKFYFSNAIRIYVFDIIADIAGERRSPLTKKTSAFSAHSGRTSGRMRGKTKAEVCRLLSIAPTSLYYYIKDHPELTEAINA